MPAVLDAMTLSCNVLFTIVDLFVTLYSMWDIASKSDAYTKLLPQSVI